MKKQWTNIDNQFFYNTMKLEDFYEDAVQGGMDTGIDVEIIRPYIQKTKTILEIGAGYGRVVTHILTRGYMGELTALEQDSKCCRLLESQFHQRVKVICSDLKELELSNRFGLILWMWAGFCEFSKSEQISMLKKVSCWLNNEGFLIVDTIPIEYKPMNSQDLDDRNRMIQTPFGTLYGYFPADEEIVEYAKQSQLIITQRISYITTVKRHRMLYVFQRI